MTSMTIKIGIGTVVAAVAAGVLAAFTFGIPEGAANAGGLVKVAKAVGRPASIGNSAGIQLAQASAPAGAPPKTLPGGASSLQEAYQDWTVVCAQRAGADAAQAPAKHCAMTQQQTSRQTGQRVMAIEMTPKGQGLDVAVFLPFGLALDKGVTVQIDDGQTSQPYRFRTCLPAGCMVPLTFDAAFIGALQKGGVLKLKAVADGGGEMPFTISLKGFSAAFQRVSALML